MVTRARGNDLWKNCRTESFKRITGLLAYNALKLRREYRGMPSAALYFILS